MTTPRSREAIIKEGCSWIDEHESVLIDLLGELVGAPSEAGEEGTHNDSGSTVGILWKFLSNYGSDITLETQPIPEAAEYLDSSRENVYAVLPGKGDTGFVATSHTDVVSPGDPAAWPSNDPFKLVEGIVRRRNGEQIVLQVEGERFEREIRDKMARIWDLRDNGARDVLIGRGVYDNKASIVSMVGSLLGLEAAMKETSRRLAGDLIQGHLVDEEVYQIGIKNMVGWGPHAANWLGDRYEDPSDFEGVVLEGSYGWVPVVGHRGLAWVELRGEGESAHASTPELANNAVVGMGKALAAMDKPEFIDALSKHFLEDELLGELSVAAGTTVVGGGVNRVNHETGEVERGDLNTIPDWCETTFDIRLPRWKGFPDDADELKKSICMTIEETASQSAPEVAFTANIGDYEFFPPAAIAPDRKASARHPLVRAAGRATEETFGYKPGIDVAPGVTDGAFLYQGTEMPTLVEYGPAGALSHEPLEFVERDQVIKGAKVLLRLTVDRLGVA